MLSTSTYRLKAKFSREAWMILKNQNIDNIEEDSEGESLAQATVKYDKNALELYLPWKDVFLFFAVLYCFEGKMKIEIKADRRRVNGASAMSSTYAK